VFIPWLSKRLERELPGSQAHATIWSYPRNSVSEGMEMVPPPRQSAVAMIINPRTAHHFELLYIVRSSFGIHGGQVAFPGGKIEPFENELQCAIRETNEEIGLQLNELDFIGKLSPVFIPPSHMIVHPHVFVLKDKNNQFDITEEVDHIFWVEHHQINLDKIIVQPHYLKAFDETRPIKGIPINGQFLWGASAMLTVELMHLHQEYLFLMNEQT
jgi:8-oxo-dGTP pyrophosphatase MutT (NUDIX family)